MTAPNLAPAACIVCGKPQPTDAPTSGWTYLAGAKPIGSMACSDACAEEAVERFHLFGRCDAKDPIVRRTY